MSEDINNRENRFGVSTQFINRWSPRSFSSEPLTEDQIMKLFEAANWSMSCFNSQPWHFFYTTGGEEKVAFESLLTPKNQSWAPAAPLLGFVTCKRQFSHNQKENRHAKYDTGAAAMALTLQAREMGLFTHFMAGYDNERAYEVLNLDPDTHEIICGFVVGKKGPKEDIPEGLQRIESPNTRKQSVEEVITKGPAKVE